MLYRGVKRCLFILSFLSVCFFTHTDVVFAQSYVPVIDINMAELFPQYTTDLFQRWDDTFGGPGDPTGTGDTLRDLIAGSDPNVDTLGGKCANGNNLPDKILLANEASTNAVNTAVPYENGTWASAYASSSANGGSLPNRVPEDGSILQVNQSQSLRCLLNDVVRWQKLSVSVQIHALLKTYIADAQTKQLNNQMMNRIAAANLDWGKAGNQINDNGILSSEAVYNTNLSQSSYNKNARQLEHITAQATADPNDGNPVGSLGICEPWRLDTAANMVRNNRGGVEDPLNYTQSVTECKLDTTLNPTDWDKFSGNFNDPDANKLGGPQTLDAILLNPANSPLGAATQADQAAYGRLARQKETTQAENANTGFTPTKVCSGLPSDPYCLDQQNSTAVSPSGQNQQTVTDMAKQGNDQIQNADTLDGQGGAEAELQSSVLNTQTGVYGYDATPLQTSQTAVNELVTEFYDAIQYGYFGVDGNTTEWAQATMLMIYDEMKFDPKSTETIVTSDQDSDPTGYGTGL